MRWLIMSHLIWIYTVCKGISFGLQGSKFSGPFESIRLIHMGRAKRKGVFQHSKNAEIQIHPAHVQSHPDICSPLTIVSNDSVNGQRECAGWLGPSMSAYAQRHVFAWRSPCVKYYFRLNLLGGSMGCIFFFILPHEHTRTYQTCYFLFSTKPLCELNKHFVLLHLNILSFRHHSERRFLLGVLF